MRRHSRCIKSSRVHLPLSSRSSCAAWPGAPLGRALRCVSATTAAQMRCMRDASPDKARMLDYRQDLSEVRALPARSPASERQRRLRRFCRLGGDPRGAEAQVEQPAPPSAKAGAHRTRGYRLSKRLMDELGQMLDAYDVVRRADEARKRRLETEGLAFLAAFAALRAKLVRPTFEAAGELLRSHGHEYTIREEEFVFEGDGKTSEASITFSITPAGLEKAVAADGARRELSLSTRHYNKTVSVTNGAVPQSGTLAAGGYGLAQIDAQLVEDELLKLVAAIVRT